MKGNHKEEAMIQNLKDAGCDDKTISAFMENLREDKINAGLKLLEIHRRSLLEDLHREQRQIDCLDYLVFTIQKKAKA